MSRLYRSSILVVYFMLEKDGKILLHRRFNTGTSDGQYCIPSGHVDDGETINDALLREAMEELGVKFEFADCDLFHVMDVGSEGEPRVAFFFRVTNWQGEPKIMEPEKCDDLQWFAQNSFPENTGIRTKLAFDALQNKIKYSEYGWREVNND